MTRSRTVINDHNLMRFLDKLHLVLEDPKTESTIAWLPHASGFKIKSNNNFESIVMKCYYKNAKFHRLCANCIVGNFDVLPTAFIFIK